MNVGIGQITRLLTGSGLANLDGEKQVQESTKPQVESSELEDKDHPHLHDRFSVSGYYHVIDQLAQDFNVRSLSGAEVNQLQNKLIEEDLLDMRNPNQGRLLRLALNDQTEISQPESGNFDMVEVMNLYHDKLQLEQAGFHPIKEAESVSRLMFNLAALRHEEPITA